MSPFATQVGTIDVPEIWTDEIVHNVGTHQGSYGGIADALTEHNRNSGQMVRRCPHRSWLWPRRSGGREAERKHWLRSLT